MKQFPSFSNDQFMSEIGMEVPENVATLNDDQEHQDQESGAPTTPSLETRIQSLSLETDSNGPELVDDSQTPNAGDTDEKPSDGEERAHVEEVACLDLLGEELDTFLSGDPPTRPSEIPECVNLFLHNLAAKITKYESRSEKIDWQRDSSQFLSSVTQVSSLVRIFSSLQASESPIVEKATSVLQQAMMFLGEEFRSILAQPPDSGNLKAGKSVNPSSDENCPSADTPQSPKDPDSAPSEPYPPGTVSILAQISKVMIGSGYETECCLAYSVARKSSLEETVSEKMSIDRISIEEVQKMNWDVLESEIVKWIKAFGGCLKVHLAGECQLCYSVFHESAELSQPVFADIARGVVLRLLNFAEAVAMTRRATERLFKFLDMYEAFRDAQPLIDDLFAGELFQEIRFEIDSARTQLGEAAIGVFSELENSIRSDSAKTPVPGGAVHPLTRYVMNYMKLACEYKQTMEQVFSACRPKPDGSGDDSRSPLSLQVVGVMDLLDHNLEMKSKLYKDQSLSYIFLMNNGRYIVQRVKGSEIYSLLGDDWYRKRSSDLRQYHKNYQRETWGRVLGCFKDEGLHSGGNGGGRVGGSAVLKPVLKERFKMFNATFEEIHKMQSSWIVSDEQLQSELRVSISAVVIPAYRSFLARYSQYLDPGRQTDKYIKYGPEDLETFIDELFEGTPASMIKRKA